jgi:uncharacterized protein YcgI (DUF1989 family)
MNEIPARSGKAVPLRKGMAVKLVNTCGSQVVDTWALACLDTTEHLSVEHTRRMLFRLFPAKGDTLYSSRRAAMLMLEDDTSPGLHDMLLACCDKWLYKFYGCPPGHANCRDNFLAALFEAGFDAHIVPNPVNFWMNIPVRDDSRIALATPLSKPGDFIVLRALMDVVVVFSACPMDVTNINGDDKTPREVHYEILQG